MILVYQSYEKKLINIEKNNFKKNCLRIFARQSAAALGGQTGGQT